MARKSNNTALNAIASCINSDLLDNKLKTTVTFVAATTGAVATHKIADVTGVVALSIIGVCKTDVAGTGTIEVGTALSSAGLIAQTTGTAIDVNEIWHDAAPDTSIELTSVVTKKIVTQNINYKVGTATLTGGVIDFYIMWSPISPDGNVTLA